ncbi:MAG: YitT family protein [Bdellovibrionales bacterium]|nr:YitT family protein [Bdellovibrionales bacterium]
MDKLVRELINGVFIILGIFSAGLGLHGFLLSSNFIDGGITGVSMLLEKTTGIPLFYLIPAVNFPFIFIGLRALGRAFAIRSCLAIAGLSIILATIEFPHVTSDLVLISVFGGFFIGAGIGLAIRGGAVLDGTEIAALIISKRNSVFGVGDLILAFNVVLFLVAISTLGVEATLYSILTYMSAAKTLDFVIHGIDEYTSVTIISPQSSAIRTRIVEELGRGVTIFEAKGGISGTSKDVLYSVVTRLEIGKIKAIVHDLDIDAFVIVEPLSEVQGGVLRKSKNI